MFPRLLAPLFCVSVTAAAAQALTPAQQMRVDVAYLASDLLAGRAAGSPFGDEAAYYIAGRMAALGLVPLGDDSTFLQEFPITVAGHGASADAPALRTSNVLGFVDRGAPATVVIGAHYDHLGFGGGGSGSLHTGEPAPHNGADDNASGVAVLLDLAARIQADSTLADYNYLLAGFSAEEIGLVGSKYLVEHLPAAAGEVAAMLNFDMVGRLAGDGVLAVNGTGTSPTWQPLLDSLAVGRAELKPYASGLGPSDHASFYLADVPVLHFFTGQHAQYHKPDDDAVLVDFAGMATVSDLVFDLLRAMPPPGQLAFAKTKDESQRAVASFQVTMGVMPDYVYGGEGMRIDGVLDGRPAQRAGIERGDVLVELDGTPIGDIYDYMDALGQHDVGQSVDVVIERGDDLLRKRVTF